jgi:hypothetical protein
MAVYEFIENKGEFTSHCLNSLWPPGEFIMAMYEFIKIRGIHNTLPEFLLLAGEFTFAA